MERPAVSFSDAEDIFDDVESDLENPELSESLKKNNVEDLKAGKVYTNRPDKTITALVIGETGTGKTSFISWAGNSVAGNAPECYKSFVDPSNEAGGPMIGSQTNSSILYEFPSSNGVTLRLLDTPGLGDTRGIACDEEHKRNIARAIADHVATADAVLILVNGTQQRLSVVTDYALNTLTSIFPRTLTRNIGFIFTNVANEYSLNFESDGLPEALRNNYWATLDNPFAMDQKRRKDLSNSDSKRRLLPWNLVLGAREASLGTLADIIDWINTLEPQPTRDILLLHEQSVALDQAILDRFAYMGQLADLKKEASTLQKKSKDTQQTMGQHQHFETIINKEVYQPVEAGCSYSVCTVPDCYANCHYSTSYFSNLALSVWTQTWMVGFRKSCRECQHPIEKHRWWKKKWMKVKVEESIMDEEAKAKYTAALEQNGEQQDMMRASEETIASLDMLISTAGARIEELTEAYAKLSISGSFSIQVQKSIALMEMHLNSLQSKESDPHSIESLKRSVDGMKRKLQAVEDVVQKPWKWWSK